MRTPEVIIASRHYKAVESLNKLREARQETEFHVQAFLESAGRAEDWNKVFRLFEIIRETLNEIEIVINK